MGDQVAVTTFGGRVEEMAKAALDQEIAHEAEAICGGLLEPLEYKRRAGILAGLRKAKELIDQAHSDAMKN